MKNILLVIGFILSPVWGWTHGEEKPGPHGGFLQMPGDFHTELVLKEKKIQIFLLDIRIENPVTENSSVQSFYQLSSSQKYKLKCYQEKSFFECLLPKEFNPKKGTLSIQAKRKEMPEAESKYTLPLKFIKHH